MKYKKPMELEWLKNQGTKTYYGKYTMLEKKRKTYFWPNMYDDLIGLYTYPWQH